MNTETRRLLDKASQEFAKTGLLPPKFHRWLLDAFDERIRGDYATGNPITGEDVDEIMAQAREFLQAAHRFLGKKNPSSSDDV